MGASVNFIIITNSVASFSRFEGCDKR
jgi:hypothetical protein